MEQSDVIRHMVNDILSDKSADAMEKFNSMMAVRVSDALDTKKQDLASTLYKDNKEEWKILMPLERKVF